MKNISLLLAITLTILSISCKENKKEPEVISIDNTVAPIQTKELANAIYNKAEFTIKGMTCQIGCAASLEKKLAKMEGVKSVTVSFEKELAVVEYDTNTLNTDDLTKTVTTAASGDVYTVEGMKIATE
ncbi:cation transporter [Cellulophaga sp. F20128]|uniref:heavy-metal-associated domain-containing protein n=1 Tax=Cellulophaga sp. F20128 TaxID=2926413 RepID=UPI001FF5630D|nr:heavy metal-associated domain-containing protein [Cellulophaga sp. F20128]MCK0158631.1 cation transporter [Cellulophaga sp. F20128]